jgi:hypothetical protein
MSAVAVNLFIHKLNPRILAQEQSPMIGFAEGERLRHSKGPMTTDDRTPDYAARIQRLRRRYRLSQNELAARLGVTAFVRRDALGAGTPDLHRRSGGGTAGAPGPPAGVRPSDQSHLRHRDGEDRAAAPSAHRGLRMDAVPVPPALPFGLRRGRGLRRSPLFHQLLQALIELAPAGSEERSLLESLSNHLDSKNESTRQTQFSTE